MQTIQPIRLEDAAGSTRRLLETVNNDRGTVPNVIKAMANSPHTLEGYVQFRRALAGGQLSPQMREQIALAVAQAGQCDYSLAQHTALAGRLGLTNDQIQASRDARGGDGGTTAALRFVRDLVTREGDCSTVELREAGYGDAEIVEMVAQAALNVFENYLATVACIEIDSPNDGRKIKAA